MRFNVWQKWKPPDLWKYFHWNTKYYRIQQNESERTGHKAWSLMARLQAELPQQLACTVYPSIICHISVVSKPCDSVLEPSLRELHCCFHMHLNKFSVGPLMCVSLSESLVLDGWLRKGGPCGEIFASISRVFVPLAETLPLCHLLPECCVRVCVC